MSTGFTVIISGFSGGCKFFWGTEEILQLGQLSCLRRLWVTGKLRAPAGGRRFPAWEVPFQAPIDTAVRCSWTRVPRGRIAPPRWDSDAPVSFETDNQPVRRVSHLTDRYWEANLPLFQTAIGKATGDITSGSRDFETGEILVQNGPKWSWPTESQRWRIGSLSPELREDDRCKLLQHNALDRRVSGGFWGDNLGGGWVRYGLDSVREADANADCGVMCGGRQRR